MKERQEDEMILKIMKFDYLTSGTGGLLEEG